MPQQKIDANQDIGKWYVMCHLNPQHIETMLQKDSAGLFCKPDETPLPPYRFYVPYQYIPALPVGKAQDDVVDDRHYRPQDDPNALRNDLHDFVFIQASEERLRAIVQSDWNTRTRLRLYHYRDTNHHVVTVSDAEVRQLMTTIQDRHLQFYIDQPLDDFAADDRVILKKEPWEGKRGVVKKVAIKKGQLCMTISMNILGRTKSINFTDVHVGDVLFEDSERGRMLTDNPITNYEEEIIDLLSHRFGRHYTDEVKKEDHQRLRRLVTYDHIYVDDADERARFLSLKLICAYLLQSQRKKALYQQEVMDLLANPSPLAPPTTAPSLSRGGKTTAPSLSREGKTTTPSLSREGKTTAPSLSRGGKTTAPSLSREGKTTTPSLSREGSSCLVPQTPAEAYLMTALFITTRKAHWRDAVKAYRSTHPDSLPVLRRYHAIIKDLKARKSKNPYPSVTTDDSR